MRKSNWQNGLLRKLILQICEYYGDSYAFLGESFCEDTFGMVKSEKGTEGVDGYIGKYAVQVKFKWITEENISSRYIAIKSDSEYDILIVVYANSAHDDVQLFGVWEKWQVEEAVRTTSMRQDRVMLKDLMQFDCFKIEKTLD